MTSATTHATKELARLILSNAEHYEWSLQGMGMLRLHMGNNTRLHVWDARFRAPGVSMIHDHLQWALESTVVAGAITNRRYAVAMDRLSDEHRPFQFATLKPGYGCFFKHEARDIWLRALPPEQYTPGMCYRQEPSEVHETDAEDGTVTIMRKTPTDDESARVFWPAGEQWGSAEPRPATADEVREITSHALARWF